MPHLLGWSFPKEAAKPKPRPNEYENAPTQVPMGRMEHGVRRNPDSGQRKVRVQQVRNQQQKTAYAPVNPDIKCPQCQSIVYGVDTVGKQKYLQCAQCGWDSKQRVAAGEGPFCPSCGGAGMQIEAMGGQPWWRCATCSREYAMGHEAKLAAPLHKDTTFRCSVCGETYKLGDGSNHDHEPGEPVHPPKHGAQNMYPGRCPDCGGHVEAYEGIRTRENGKWVVRHKEGEHEDERAGPWKSGEGDYPFADEVYDLTHSSEPDYDSYYGAKTAGMLEDIRDHDPDGFPEFPTNEAYAKFEAWVKSTYGNDAWSQYKGWGRSEDTPYDPTAEDPDDGRYGSRKVAEVQPRCAGCGKTPDELMEYREMVASGDYSSADEAVRNEEGTYNPETGAFLCTPCYVKAGMPTSPTGWKASKESTMNTHEGRIYTPGDLDEPRDRLSGELGEPEHMTCPHCGSATAHKSTGYCPSCGKHSKASKGIPMNFVQQEAQLLNAMAKASLPEQRVLAQRLEEVRAEARRSFQADRDLDLSSAVIRDHLTPVATHGMNTTATDWFNEIAIEADYDRDTDLRVRAEASMWFARTSPEVRADHEEFFEQAQGMARRTAGLVGDVTGNAARSFLEQACHLAGIVLAGNEDDYNDDTWGDVSQEGPTNWPITSPEGESTGATQDWGLVPNATASLGDKSQGTCDKCGKKGEVYQGRGADGEVEYLCAEHTDQKKSSFRAQGSPQPGDADDSGQASSGLPNEVTLSDAPDVLDNFAPPVAPANSGISPEDVSSMRAPIIQENKQDEVETGGAASPSIADQSGQAGSSLPQPNDQRPAYTSGKLGDHYISAEGHAIACTQAATATTSAVWEDFGLIPSKAPLHPSAIHAQAARVIAAGEKCQVCGAPIERDPAGEDNRSWHHADGDKHDHEAKPSSEEASETPAEEKAEDDSKKESKVRRVQAGGLDNFGDNKAKPFGSKDDDDDDKKEARRVIVVDGIRYVAADPIADPSGQGVSGLPQVAEDEDTVMWPWELNEQGKQPEQGAANVDSVPTPGKGVADYPQPKSSARMQQDAAKQAAFRARVQQNLTRA